MRILFVNNVSVENHLWHFTEAMRLAMEALGCETSEVTLNLGHSGSHVALRRRIEQFAPDWLFGFGSKRLEARRLADAVTPRLPVLLYALSAAPPEPPALGLSEVYGVYPSNRSLALAREQGVPAERSWVLPAAGRAAMRARNDDRPIDIFYSGSIQDPNALYQEYKSQLQPSKFALFCAAAETWLHDLQQDPREIVGALSAELVATAVDLEAESASFATGEILNRVSSYVRNRARLRVVQRLRSLPITFAGTGWQQLVPSKRFSYLPAMRFHHSQELLRCAKVGLNLEPCCNQLAGPRAWETIMNDAALVTTESSFLNAALCAGADFVPFTLSAGSIEGAVEQTHGLIANDSKRRSLAERAQAKVLQAHTWRHRAEMVLTWMRAAMGSEARQRARADQAGSPYVSLRPARSSERRVVTKSPTL